MQEIVTERLVLRLLRAEDVPAFAAYRSGPGRWVQVAAVDRESGELCGDCAVRVETDQPQTAEVGVALAPSRQGGGLASEALGAVDNMERDEGDRAQPLRLGRRARAARRGEAPAR